MVHPFLLSKGLRWGLTQAASRCGLRLEMGRIHASVASPFVFENIRLRAKDPVLSRTAANIDKVEVVWNWPWQMAFGPQRLWRSVVLDGMRGVFDFRPSSTPSQNVAKVSSKAVEEKQKAGLLCFPEQIRIGRATMEFLAKERSIYLQEASLNLNEKELGEFQAAGGEVQLGGFRQTLGALEGVTAWKGGTVYLAELGLRDGIKIENFHAELASPDGVSLGVEAEVFGGALRGDLSFVGNSGIEAAIWATNINLESLPDLLGVKGESDGVLREGRFTFRGQPARAADAEASLRLSAEGFRWNKRGWESLQVGASLIHHRLVVNDLVLQQKGNQVKGNGEVSLAEGWTNLSKAPFLLNVSASIQDLGALAGLFGTPFDEMSGRMSLSSSVSGRTGKMDGFLNLEASEVNFRKRPIESAKIGITFSNNEAQLTLCELWSGKDYLWGGGTVELSAPYRYSGEMEGKAADVAGYVGLFRTTNTPAIYAGSLNARWQGDGTLAAHSGAFTVTLDDFISEKTPAGLTGKFAGTYSPQNIYFSDFELSHGPMRFFTRATLAKSGVKLVDMALKNGGRQVATGEFFLPVNPFAVTAGKTWKEAIDPAGELYASFAMREELALANLLRLAGQSPSARGLVKFVLQANGVPSAPAGSLSLEVKGLAQKLKDDFGPSSSVKAEARAEKGVATLDGSLATEGFLPATLKAEFPLGLFKTSESTWKWMNPTQSMTGKLSLPRASLASLHMFSPRLSVVSGPVAGELTFAGTPEKPQIEGVLEVAEGKLNLVPLLPSEGIFTSILRFNAGRAVFEKCAGSMGGGTFDLKGGVTFSNPANLQYDLSLNVRKIPVANDAGLKLRADADLLALGDITAGSLKGSVRLVDGSFSKRMEITPLSVLSPLGSKTRWTFSQNIPHVPASWTGWALDVSVTNATPFALGANVAAGEILPDLRLVGTLANPVPTGHVEIKNARVFLPFTTMLLDSARVDFFEGKPWIPQLDVRGSAQALDYRVQAYALGAFDERRLILRSDPPLSQDDLIRLLTTGLAPGVYAPAASGPAASVPALPPNKNNPALLFQRLQVSSPAYPAGGAALHGRFRLWEGLSLTGERDEMGFSNGVTYHLRFR